jgi:hypothetical protein
MPRSASNVPGPSKTLHTGSSPAETRRHLRFPVALAVKCTERIGQKPRHWRGRTADVSGGGFAIELPVKLAAGKKLNIEVRTGIGPMRLEAEVLWARKVARESALYRHGLRLAEGSEVLDLPVTVLLGEWLRKMAREEDKTARASRRPVRRAPARSAPR